MTECECEPANGLGFHLALSPSLGPVPPERELAQIISIARQLPSGPPKLSSVETALVLALAGARQMAPNKRVYVCGGVHKDELLLAVTHQGVSCGRGTGGPVTCAANVWQVDVADYLLNRRLIDRVEFGLNGKRLVLCWRGADAASFSWPGLLRALRAVADLRPELVRERSRAPLTESKSTK